MSRTASAACSFVIVAVCVPVHKPLVQRPVAERSLLEIAQRPTSQRAGIGSAHEAVTTAVPEAQIFYDQGLACLHSYVWLEAARSFNQALRLDPQLVMAYVGLTVAYTELNAPAAAKSALDRANALTSQLTDHERRRVNARALQMSAEAVPGDPAPLAAYRRALDDALTKYPSDEQLWLLRGLAESPDPAERGQGSVTASAGFYKKALAIAPTHFAAHHYLAHVYENAGQIDEALTEATVYATMAPAVPHAHHMHGHELRRLERVDDAIEEFQIADRLASAFFQSEKIPVEYDWHYQHNLDLLATSYQYIGQMTKAEDLLKASFAIPSTSLEQEFNKREWPVFLLARRRSRESLAAAGVLAAHPSPLVSATGHLESGRAHLALQEYQPAADEANAALRLMRNSPEGAGLLARSLKALQGEFFLRTGQRDRGRAALEEVSKEVRAAAGPDAWIQGLFTLDAMARAAREVEDWELAERLARDMLAHDPAYAGSHYALGLVADHEGDRGLAVAELSLARKYWARADHNLGELVDIRERLRGYKD
jgi:tetratricopeptide (TPR) repeat protein